MLEKKIINGSNFIIKLGTNKLDIMIGLKIGINIFENRFLQIGLKLIQNWKL